MHKKEKIPLDIVMISVYVVHKEVRGMKRLMVFLEDEIHRALKIRAAMEGVPLRNKVAEILKKEVDCGKKV